MKEGNIVKTTEEYNNLNGLQKTIPIIKGVVVGIEKWINNNIITVKIDNAEREINEYWLELVVD